jgi:hypothetical protein
MTQRELLTALDTFPRAGISSYEGALAEASKLMRLAAAEIRRLNEQLTAEQSRRTWLTDLDEEAEAGL